MFSNAALHWVTRADAAVEGIARALRPGGRFVAEFGGFGNVAAIRTALVAVLAREGVTTTLEEVWFFPTPEDYAARLACAGLAVEEIALVPRPTRVESGMARLARDARRPGPRETARGAAERRHGRRRGASRPGAARRRGHLVGRLCASARARAAVWLRGRRMQPAAQALALVLALAGTAEAQIESAPLDPPEGLAPAPGVPPPLRAHGPEAARAHRPRGDRRAHGRPAAPARQDDGRDPHRDPRRERDRHAGPAGGDAPALPRPGRRQPAGTKAFLKIRDLGHEGAEEDDAPLPRGAAFVDAQRPGRWRGWMLADSPALSALDHPRYDLWLISCTTSEAGVASESE